MNSVWMWSRWIKSWAWLTHSDQKQTRCLIFVFPFHMCSSAALCWSVVVVLLQKFLNNSLKKELSVRNGFFFLAEQTLSETWWKTKTIQTLTCICWYVTPSVTYLSAVITGEINRILLPKWHFSILVRDQNVLDSSLHKYLDCQGILGLVWGGAAGTTSLKWLHWSLSAPGRPGGAGNIWLLISKIRLESIFFFFFVLFYFIYLFF